MTERTLAAIVVGGLLVFCLLLGGLGTWVVVSYR